MVNQSADVPDHSIRISIDRVSPFRPLRHVKSYLLLLWLWSYVFVIARAVLLPTSSCEQYMPQHPIPQYYLLFQISSLWHPYELSSLILQHSLPPMLSRSYQESTSSGSDDRKEFILKLLSQDPSNYADAPTGKHRLISLHCIEP